MKETFRQSMAWLHSWAGLIVGWVLFFVFVSGTATYFRYEITRWMEPELPLHQELSHPAPAIMVEKALNFLGRQPEAANSWRILLPKDGSRMGCGFQCNDGDVARGYQSDLIVRWGGKVAHLDAVTGKELPPAPSVRDTRGGELLHDMHYSLRYIGEDWGKVIVTVCAMFGLLVIASGVIVHKKIFKDFFTFRPGKGQRSWLDGHNVVSVMALPFFVMITFSGMQLQPYTPKPLMESPKERAGPPRRGHEAAALTRPAAPIAPIMAAAETVLGKGEPAVIELSHPAGKPPLIVISRSWGTEWPLMSRYGSEISFNADTGEMLNIPNEFGQTPSHKTLWFFTVTHNAWFAGTGLRWLFFVSGLLGCVMIATGLVLWTVKRREKYARRNETPFGLPLVEHLNAGVIVGLPIGIAAYFWANRLLPLTLADRADWEANNLFLTWGWMLLYALLRPANRAWVELLWLAAAAFCLVPLINFLTTDKHLGVTIPNGDWVLAGIDLTLFGLGAIFALIAFRLQQKQRQAREDIGATTPPSLAREIAS